MTESLSDNDMTRVRKYLITRRSLFEMFAKSRPHSLPVPTSELPDGAEVLFIYPDIERNAIALIVEHPSFEPVPDGCEAPIAGDRLRICTEYLPVVGAQAVDLKSATVDELRSLKDAINERLYDLERKEAAT